MPALTLFRRYIRHKIGASDVLRATFAAVFRVWEGRDRRTYSTDRIMLLGRFITCVVMLYRSGERRTTLRTEIQRRHASAAALSADLVSAFDQNCSSLAKGP